MRVMLSLAILAALSACEREPSFDERFDSAQQEIEAKASELDEDLAKGAAQEGEPEASEPSARQ